MDKEEEIIRRLQKLREPSSSVQSTDEQIRHRLNLLKDTFETATSDTDKSIIITKQKTQSEQVEDLLNQYSSECAIRKNANKTRVSDIEQRLNNLKGFNSVADVNQVPERLSISQQTKKLVSGILASVELDKKMNPESEESDNDEATLTSTYVENHDSDSEVDGEEIPTCFICDQIAEYKCTNKTECDGDLYCSACFNEYHKDLEDNSHKKTLLQPNKRHKTHSRIVHN